MKISDAIKNTAGLGIDKPSTGKASAGSAKPAEKSQTDVKQAENVTLSARASQLQSLEASVAASSVFDAEKVDAIKSAIAGGQFKVNSEKVADGLIDTVKNLLSDK